MKLTKRKGFNFFRSYFDVYNELKNNSDKVDFIDALLNRQFLGIKPTDLNGMAKFAYISQTNSIDSQVKGYEDKTKTKLNPLEPTILTPSTPPTYGGSIPPTLQVEEKEKEKEKEKRLFDFETFWKTYDKMEGKKKALEKFLKLPQKDVDKILTVVKNYVVSTPDKKYRKNPLTWLNGENWNDQIKKVKKQNNQLNSDGTFKMY